MPLTCCPKSPVSGQQSSGWCDPLNSGACNAGGEGDFGQFVPLPARRQNQDEVIPRQTSQKPTSGESARIHLADRDSSPGITSKLPGIQTS